MNILFDKFNFIGKVFFCFQNIYKFEKAALKIDQILPPSIQFKGYLKGLCEIYKKENKKLVRYGCLEGDFELY